MPAEIGLVVVVALLWGPTALWLAYRVVRIRQDPDRHGLRSGSSVHGAVSTEPDTVGELVGRGDYWVCGSCRSFNHPRARSCYSCRAPRGAEVDRDVDDDAGREPVPVMADHIAHAPAPAVAVPAVAGIADPLTDERLAVCPLLGLADDPATWYDGPNPMNVCHAAAARAQASSGWLGQLIASVAEHDRRDGVDLAYQESRCLTATYGQCHRFPRAMLVPQAEVSLVAVGPGVAVPSGDHEIASSASDAWRERGAEAPPQPPLEPAQAPQPEPAMPPGPVPVRAAASRSRRSATAGPDGRDAPAAAARRARSSRRRSPAPGDRA